MGLGRQIKVEDFDEHHIQVVAPIVLGEAVWELFSEESYRNWEDFKGAVDRRFGLTK